MGAPPTLDHLRRTDLVLAALLLLAGTGLAMALFSLGKGAMRPNIEDEAVYLFQAKTLAAGHLSYPAPPLPEFFESAHILVVPRFAAKYLPGHAAVLAPFLALGVPWLAPCLMLGLTAALIFLAGRRAGLSRPGALLGAAMLMAASDVVPWFASYLSQSTSTAAVAAGLLAALAVQANPTRGRIIALSAIVVFAGLVRPFTGGALAVAAAALLLRLRPPLRDAGWALLPVAAGAAFAAAVCHGVTGSWITPPWALYARQYMPFDGPGFGAVQAPPPSRGLPPHLTELSRGFLASRLKHTVARLPAEALRRLVTVLQLSPSWAAIPFAAVGLFRAPLWFGTVFAAAYFALALGFHAGGHIYYLDLAPWLAVVTAAGVETVVRAVLRLRRPLALAACCALALPALWVGTGMVTEFGLLLSRTRDRPWTYARWEPAFEWLRERGALVFIHYPPGWDGNLDLTFNEPDLARAELVRAIDLGERDAELLPWFPGRPAFVLDASTLGLRRIR